MLLKGILFFILGLIIGSFLNAAIYRLKHGKGIVKTRSFCPNCGHCLGFWDLIPLFSFIFLKGRCRYCGEKISIQYPLVEFLTGSLFLFVFLTVGVSNLLYITYLLIIFSFLVVILVYDLKGKYYKQISDIK